MSLIRAFIAIDLPDEIRIKLDGIVQKLKSQQVRSIRWVAVDNIHITIKFLGEIPTNRIESLAKTISAVCAGQSAFPIEVGGLGAFPNHRRPRVIWVGLQAPPAMQSLHEAVEQAASDIEVAPEDRPFSPHLTLGRVKNDAAPLDLRYLGEALDTTQVGTLGGFMVSHITLFRSELRPQGPLYTVLDRFKLA